MKSLAILILAGSLLFFLIGLYELSKARETACWIARPAKITAFQVHEGEDSGSYVTIDGVFVDRGGVFSVKRYAYGVLNGMTPNQAYLAPYKPGFKTTVFVDPNDASNVILCNTPSLTFQYGELVVTACLCLVSMLYLIFKRKKTGDSSVLSSSSTARTVELPRWAGILIGLGMAFLFLGLGVWIIRMGIAGRSPAETWTSGQATGALLMGILFAYGGLQSMILVIWGNRLPQIAHKIMLSLFLVVLGLPFIAIPIVDPGGISSSTSINGLVVHKTQDSSAGAVVFMAAGILCVFGALWPWRWWKKKN